MTWLQLGNRTAIITGAGSGIGKGISKALFQQGCHVILADMDDSKIDDTAHELSSNYHTTSQNDALERYPFEKNNIKPMLRTFSCDVTNSSQVEKLMNFADSLRNDVQQRTDDQGNLPNVASILVNCAGITKDGFMFKMNEDDFDSVMNVNLKGTFLTCKYFCQKSRLESLQSWNKNKNNTYSTIASIVNIGSVVGTYGNIGQSNYAASKGGVTSLTRTLAKEVAPFGVRVNVVLPGFVDTPMLQKVPNKYKEKLMNNNLTLKRFGTVEDVANLSLFLASEARSGYITGQAIECSGMLAL